MRFLLKPLEMLDARAVPRVQARICPAPDTFENITSASRPGEKGPSFKLETRRLFRLVCASGSDKITRLRCLKFPYMKAKNRARPSAIALAAGCRGGGFATLRSAWR